MKEISVKRIQKAVYSACVEIACTYGKDLFAALEKGRSAETEKRAVIAMDMLVENAKIAQKEHIPLCQDTGLVIVFLKIGQDVHLTEGNLKQAVDEAVGKAYTDAYLRASCVSDPVFDRKNTTDNTPAILYTEIVPGESVVVEVMAKGFGSENKSALKMLTPAEGKEGITRFILDTVQQAGPNACPPFVIGVGIGGTFDSCAVLSKKALLRPISLCNPDERYAAYEQELLEKVNALHIGPMGFHGNTTALKVQIEQAPTHIAGLPVAVNICCHVCRHKREVIA